MSRRKRAGFGDVATAREAFARGETKCPTCHRPIGPNDRPSFVQSFGGAPPRLATLKCGRCNAMLTVRFEDEEPKATA